MLSTSQSGNITDKKLSDSQFWLKRWGLPKPQSDTCTIGVLIGIPDKITLLTNQINTPALFSNADIFSLVIDCHLFSSNCEKKWLF